MKLKSYLNFTKKSVTQAAKELKINRQYLHCLLVGKNNPGRKLAMRIREWSDNTIDYKDMWG